MLGTLTKTILAISLLTAVLTADRPGASASAHRLVAAGGVDVVAALAAGEITLTGAAEGIA